MAQNPRISKSSIAGVDFLSVTSTKAKNTVIMLHGFGASCEDLFDIHSILDPNGLFNWIFPDGVLAVPIGPHMVGRAWFPIRMADIEAAASRGGSVDFSDMTPDGMLAAESKLLNFIKELRIPSSNLLLGGFSQGAMMSVQIAPTLGPSLKGLILFSGTLINRPSWETNLPKIAKVPFIQSHGANDLVLGFNHAKRLNSLLVNSGLVGEFIPFDGSHEIPMPVLRKAEKFLSSLAKE